MTRPVATPRVCLHNLSALTTSTPTAAPAPAAIRDGDAPPDLIGGVYRPDTWGAGHIAINAAGHVEIVPDPAPPVGARITLRIPKTSDK